MESAKSNRSMGAQTLSPGDLSYWMRAGWAARGISYAASGVLALSLATTVVSFAEKPTQKGAIELLGELPGGKLLLLILALGLLGFALWEAITIVQVERDSVLTYVDHIGKVIGVGFYLTLAYSAIQSVLGRVGGSGSVVERLSRFTLSFPLGRVVMVGAGLVLAGIAARRLRRSWTADFDDSLVRSSMSDFHGSVVSWLGRAGELGRGLSFLVIGFFVALAGVLDNGNEAKGLAGSLRTLSGDAWGRLGIGVIGLGFVAYGLFSLISAPARRLPHDRG